RRTPGSAPRRTSRTVLLDLIVLDQRVREQPFAHLRQLRRIVDIELDQATDVNVVNAVEAERRERPFDRLALRIEDALLRPDEDPGPHRTPVRRRQLLNGSPTIRSYASMYFSRVRATTSAGIAGAGG